MIEILSVNVATAKVLAEKDGQRVYSGGRDKALYRRRPDIQARFRPSARTGWYLRVIAPGEIVAGSEIEVVARDPAGLTIADAHADMGDRHLARRDLVEALAYHAALADQWREPLRERLARG